MEKLKKLLEKQVAVWFIVEKHEQKRFLKWAKNNGCKWSMRDIEPEKDSCGVHMGIDKNLNLGFVGGHCWFMSNNAPQKIYFRYIGE